MIILSYTIDQKLLHGSLIAFEYSELCFSINVILKGESAISANHTINKKYSLAIEAARMGMTVALNLGLGPTDNVEASDELKRSILSNLKFVFSGIPSINTEYGGCPGVEPSEPDWGCF